MQTGPGSKRSSETGSTGTSRCPPPPLLPAAPVQIAATSVGKPRNATLRQNLYRHKVCLKMRWAPSEESLNLSQALKPFCKLPNKHSRKTAGLLNNGALIVRLFHALLDRAWHAMVTLTSCRTMTTSHCALRISARKCGLSPHPFWPMCATPSSGLRNDKVLEAIVPAERSEPSNYP